MPLRLDDVDLGRVHHHLHHIFLAWTAQGLDDFDEHGGAVGALEEGAVGHHFGNDAAKRPNIDLISIE